MISVDVKPTRKPFRGFYQYKTADSTTILHFAAQQRVTVSAVVADEFQHTLGVARIGQSRVSEPRATSSLFSLPLPETDRNNSHYFLLIKRLDEKAKRPRNSAMAANQRAMLDGDASGSPDQGCDNTSELQTDYG